MLFTIEHNGPITCRTICNDIMGPVWQYNEVTYSKFFGFICHHIFETMRQTNSHENFIADTMINIFKTYPIKFGIVYKNNTELNQGGSCDINDFNNTVGSSGYGSKPSKLTRAYNKQIVVAFEFINEPTWIDDFVNIWKNRGIDLKGAMGTKKNIVPNINDIMFDYDDTIAYYTYINFKKSKNSKPNPNKMLFMLNTQNTKESVYIEDLEIQHINSFDRSDVFKEIQFIDVGV